MSHHGKPSLSLSGLDSGSTPLANQVAGHQNVLSDSSGSLVIKPALPREIAFYQYLNSVPRKSRVGRLKGLIPAFYGTLRLEGHVDELGLGDGGEEGKGRMLGGGVPESVVLENMSHPFTRPCILDVKLGTVLYSPDASEEKKQRMRKNAEGTTIGLCGMRLTGCQTWHPPSQSYILTPKSYGKSLTATDLPEGMTRFFPLPTDIIPSLIVPPTPPPTSSTTSTSPSTNISQLPLPSKTTDAPPTPDTPSSAPITTTATSIASTQNGYTNHSIPPRSMERLLKIVDEELARLESALKGFEARFVGSSVLVVYEGDAGRLEGELDRYETMREKNGVSGRFEVGMVGGDDYDGDEEEEEEEEEEEDEDEDGSDSESDSDEDDGVKADERKARRCPPVVVRMIDFAHTWRVEGEGEDVGVLKGLGTLRGLVKGRGEVVRRALSGAEEGG